MIESCFIPGNIKQKNKTNLSKKPQPPKNKKPCRNGTKYVSEIEKVSAIISTFSGDRKLDKLLLSPSAIPVGSKTFQFNRLLLVLLLITDPIWGAD